MVISEVALGLFVNLLSDNAMEILGDFYTPSLNAYNKAVKKLREKYLQNDKEIKNFLELKNVKAVIKEYLEHPENSDLLMILTDDFLKSYDKDIFLKERARSILKEFFNFLDAAIKEEPELRDRRTLHIVEQIYKIVYDTGNEVQEAKKAQTNTLEEVLKLRQDMETYIKNKDTNNPPDTTLEYAKNIYNRFSKSENLNCYIDMRCTDDSENVVLIDNYVEKWLREKKDPVLAILGDFGTGKTTYVTNLVKRFADQYINNNDSYLPVLVRLKDFTKECNLEDLIKIENFSNRLSIEDFTNKIDSGKILFVFDGYDELPNGTIEKFKKVNSQASEMNKILITSRTHYFKYRKDEKLSLHPESINFTGILLNDEYKVRVVYINLFTEEDVIKYLEKSFEDSWAAKYEIINNTYNLRDLSSRPILLDLIVRTLPKLSVATEDITISKLYDIYINGWMNREQYKEKWKDVDPKYVSSLMEELAFKMFYENKTVITFDELNEVIDWKFSSDITNKRVNIEDLNKKIRTGSFIYRDSDDNFMFMHKSFMEFFVAKKLSEEINKGVKDLNGLGKSILTSEIIYFIKDMINDKSNLYNIISFTKGKTENEAGFLGSNAITLLKCLNEDLRKSDFSSTILSYADMSNCDLSETCFKKSLMKNVKLSGSILKFADFSEADLNGAVLDTSSKFNCFSWSPDYNFFATAGDDNIVRIWDASTYRQVKIFHSEDSPRCLSWSKKYPLLVCGNSNGSLNIWNFEDEKLYTRISFQHDGISAIALCDDCLICGDLGGHIVRYDLEPLKDTQHLVIKETQQIERKGRINKLVSIDSLGHILISSDDGLEILGLKDLNTVSLIGKDKTSFCVNENDKKIIYTGYDPTLPDRYEIKYYVTRLYAREISSLKVEALRSWACQLHKKDEYNWTEYIHNKECDISDICGNPLSCDFSLIVHNREFKYDSERVLCYSTEDYIDLLLMTGNEMVKKVPIKHFQDLDMYLSGERMIHLPSSYNLCYSPDGNKLAYLYYGVINIIDADQSKDSFGESVKVIKRSINCEGMIIDNTTGLNDKQIEIIKDL